MSQNVKSIVVCGFLIKWLIKYAENVKKIVGAIWELPAKYHSQSSPFPPPHLAYDFGTKVQKTIDNNNFKMLQNRYHIKYGSKYWNFRTKNCMAGLWVLDPKFKEYLSKKCRQQQL